VVAPTPHSPTGVRELQFGSVQFRRCEQTFFPLGYIPLAGVIDIAMTRPALLTPGQPLKASATKFCAEPQCVQTLCASLRWRCIDRFTGKNDRLLRYLSAGLPPVLV